MGKMKKEDKNEEYYLKKIRKLQEKLKNVPHKQVSPTPTQSPSPSPPHPLTPSGHSAPQRSPQMSQEQVANAVKPDAECVVQGVLALVLRGSRCAGVAPLSVISEGTGWRVSVSVPLAYLQRVFVTALNVIILTGLMLDIYQDPDRHIRVGDSTITVFLWLMDQILVMGIATVLVYRGPSKMESLIRILNHLDQINMDLNNVACAKTEKQGRIVFAFMVGVTVMLQLTQGYYLIREVAEDGRNWWIMLMYTTYYYADLLGLLAVLQWGFTVLAIHSAAASLNQHLLRLRHVKLRDDRNEVQEVYSNLPKTRVDCFTERIAIHPGSEFAAYPSQVRVTIHRLAGYHDHIGELIKQMNAANGTIITAFVMCTFIHLVLTPYYLLLSFNVYRDVRVLVEVLMSSCWITIDILRLLIIVEPCHWAHSEREATKFQLSQLLVRLAPRSKKIAQALDLFAKQLFIYNAKFTPLGILTLGRPLMATMFGSVTTYLVIIVQFHTFTGSGGY